MTKSELKSLAKATAKSLFWFGLGFMIVFIIKKIGN